MIIRLIVAIAISGLLGACAVGNQYDYSTSTPDVSVTSEQTIVASVVDFRPYVLSGNKSPSFVGLQRGGFGNPFDVTTQSGQPLAADVTEALVRALKARGGDAKALTLSQGTSLDNALLRFQTIDGDRYLLVRMREWKTDAMMRLTLHWDLSAAVLDRSGTELARHAISGVEPVGAAGFESGNSEAAKQQISRKLSELLNQPDIVAALR